MAIFKSIPGFPGYKAGDNGTIWSHKFGEWRKLKPHKIRPNRLQIKLFRHGVGRLYGLARIILLTFVGPCPEGMQCCHWDDNGLNNRLSNLRWDTIKANMADRDRNEKTQRGTKHYDSRLSDDDVRAIRERGIKGKRGIKKQLASEYGVSDVMVGRIIRRENWTRVA